jgi:hypothetical protein
LEELANERLLLLENPNEYALSVASVLDSVPCTNSGYLVCDESVPFYQMVVRGSLDYACQPLNYAADYQTALLNAIECGAQLSFLFSYTRNAVLKDSDYAWLDRGWYGDWIRCAVDAYLSAYETLKPVAGQAIVSHKRVADGIYATGYEGGGVVYVNYRSDPYLINDITIPAYGFVLAKGDV